MEEELIKKKYAKLIEDLDLLTEMGAYEYASPFFITMKKANLYKVPTSNPYYHFQEPTVKVQAKARKGQLRQYYYATYSDGEQRYDVFNDLKSAVRAYSRDIMGHTLSHIKDENGTVLWAAEGGYYPKQPMAERAIENTTAETVARFIKDYNGNFVNYVVDPTTQNIGVNTGVSYSFNDGIITLKDAKDTPRKTFKITIEEVALVKHKFNSEFECETCGRHMAAIPEPAGLCLLGKEDELSPAPEEAQGTE